MKIPVYRSRAISQQVRPGSPLRGTVRMNPQAMAQAEIAKANMTIRAFNKNRVGEA